jgi:hypothetical protein
VRGSYIKSLEEKADAKDEETDVVVLETKEKQALAHFQKKSSILDRS